LNWIKKRGKRPNMLSTQGLNSLILHGEINIETQNDYGKSKNKNIFNSKEEINSALQVYSSVRDKRFMLKIYLCCELVSKEIHQKKK